MAKDEINQEGIDGTRYSASLQLVAEPQGTEIDASRGEEGEGEEGASRKFSVAGSSSQLSDFSSH